MARYILASDATNPETEFFKADGTWAVPPSGGGAAPVGTKLTDFTALTGANVAANDIIEIVDVSDTTMAASGTNKKMTMAELRLFLSNPAALYNASIASQGPGFATDTYVTGSGIVDSGHQAPVQDDLPVPDLLVEDGCRHGHAHRHRPVRDGGHDCRRSAGDDDVHRRYERRR